MKENPQIVAACIIIRELVAVAIAKHPPHVVQPDAVHCAPMPAFLLTPLVLPASPVAVELVLADNGLARHDSVGLALSMQARRGLDGRVLDGLLRKLLDRSVIYCIQHGACYLSRCLVTDSAGPARPAPTSTGRCANTVPFRLVVCPCPPGSGCAGLARQPDRTGFHRGHESVSLSHGRFVEGD